MLDSLHRHWEARSNRYEGVAVVRYDSVDWLLLVSVSM